MYTADLKLTSLLLDPNNYRLQDESGFQTSPGSKFHLESVQRATLQRLKLSNIKDLRNSIVANGFLPIERIVVAPYDNQDLSDQYLVVEGNRRVAALKQIAEELAGGIELPNKMSEIIHAVPCVVVEPEDGGAYFKETLMGISDRHSRDT